MILILTTGRTKKFYLSKNEIEKKLKINIPNKILLIAEAIRKKIKISKIYKLSKIDPWFLEQIKEIVDAENQFSKKGLPKKFNENAMGDLHKEAVNPAAAIRAALGGLVLSIALIAFMSRGLEQGAMSVILCAIGIGLVTTIIFVILNKIRGFSPEIPYQPLILLGILSVIAFTATSEESASVSAELSPELVSPDVYRVLFEDENIKVIEVEHEPGESDDFHGHYPMTWYAIQGGMLEMTTEDAKL